MLNAISKLKWGTVTTTLSHTIKKNFLLTLSFSINIPPPSQGLGRPKASEAKDTFVEKIPSHISALKQKIFNSISKVYVLS